MATEAAVLASVAVAAKVVAAAAMSGGKGAVCTGTGSQGEGRHKPIFAELIPSLSPFLPPPDSFSFNPYLPN